MLEEHSNKDMLLPETVKETIHAASHESIPKYIESGIRQLNEHADDYIKMLNWNQQDWSSNMLNLIIILKIWNIIIILYLWFKNSL